MILLNTGIGQHKQCIVRFGTKVVGHQCDDALITLTEIREYLETKPEHTLIDYLYHLTGTLRVRNLDS
jgi:hypothetical protein